MKTGAVFLGLILTWVSAVNAQVPPIQVPDPEALQSGWDATESTMATDTLALKAQVAIAIVLKAELAKDLFIKRLVEDSPGQSGPTTVMLGISDTLLEVGLGSLAVDQLDRASRILYAQNVQNFFVKSVKLEKVIRDTTASLERLSKRRRANPVEISDLTARLADTTSQLEKLGQFDELIHLGLRNKVARLSRITLGGLLVSLVVVQGAMDATTAVVMTDNNLQNNIESLNDFIDRSKDSIYALDQEKPN